MPKRIRQDEDLYIAPSILGIYREEQYLAIDERNNNQELNPEDIDNKIIIYERQVEEWFLNRAKMLLDCDHNNFVVLMICMSYLEGVEQYIQGKSSNGNSNAMFIDSLSRIYPTQFTKKNLKKLYHQSRSSLFHNGMVGRDVIIDNRFAEPIKFDTQDIKINPRKLLFDIQNDFKSYILKLKNVTNADLRELFNQMFSVIPH